MTFKIKINHPKLVSIRALPLNLFKYDKYLFKDELIKVIPDSHILYYSNLVIIENTIFDIKNNLTRYSWVGKMGFLKRIFIFLKFLNIFKHKDIINKGAWVIDNLSEGYFHWIGDVLPRIESARKDLGDYKIVLPASFEGIDYVTSSLNALGVQYIFISKAGKLIIRDAMIISHSAPTGNYNKNILLHLKCQFNDWINKISSFKSGNSNIKHKIYISRKYANKRRVINEDDVIQFMLICGFKIIYAEKLSFVDQVLLFKDAEILVGLHGAGLVNMLFMTKDSYLIEFRRHGDSRNNCFFTMASDLMLNYYYLLAEPEGGDFHTGDCYINICLLAEVINDVERRIKYGVH